LASSSARRLAKGEQGLSLVAFVASVAICRRDALLGYNGHITWEVAMPARAYDAVRASVERLGGTMVYERRGFPHGAWVIKIGDKSATIEAGGNCSFPPLDNLYLLARQRRRKIVEEGFGWMKTIGGLRKLRHRGTAKASALFTFTCAAHNLVRLRTLLAEPALT
jgi:Transposase DDE domain